MHSIRSKFTLLTITIVIITVLLIGLIGLFFTMRVVRTNSEQIMLLICETKKEAIDQSLRSIEQSVETVSKFASSKLRRMELSVYTLHSYLDQIDMLFNTIAVNTHGALTYYHRIAPEISEVVGGFWYTRTGSDSFESHELTDVKIYDRDDISHIGWYVIPQDRGTASWLGLYHNDNLDADMISYVAPLYYDGTFFGVIGMDISFSTLLEQLTSIHIYDTGYAFLLDKNGNVVYHPELPPGSPLNIDVELSDTKGIHHYSYNGIQKRAAWETLENGMYLFVSAPEQEINRRWYVLANFIISVSLIIIILSVIATRFAIRHVTDPLKRLTEAAVRIRSGDYDIQLDYDDNDEVGILTSTFQDLSSHMKAYISDLNSRAYVDALTHVRNKGAFAMCIEQLDDKIQSGTAEFAICMFDCNDLKVINDLYGHDKGDIYLQTACHSICHIFQHSPVFRIGGDEFAAVLEDDDYNHREELIISFMEHADVISRDASNSWEKISVACGIAVYDPHTDSDADTVLKRADADMYKNKKLQKSL